MMTGPGHEDRNTSGQHSYNTVAQAMGHSPHAYKYACMSTACTDQ